MKICPECKKEFKPKRREQIYCSRSCSSVKKARDRKRAIRDEPLTTIWSCGGGIQSIAIAVLIVNGELPRPDHAIMTDCGYDASYTIKYANEILRPELEEIGLPFTIIKSRDYTDVRLFMNDNDNDDRLLIPAHTRKNGKVIKFASYCNSVYKTRPAIMWIREQGIKRCENWVGISTDEARRARSSGRKWISYKYPLIDLGLNRDDCAWLIGAHGWPRPERSSCVMCPQQSKDGWERMRRCYPADYERAREIEAEIRSRRPDVYLHRDMTPLPPPAPE